VRFKQQATTVFLVAAKESVTHIHYRTEMCTVSMLVTKAPFVVGLHELYVLRKASRKLSYARNSGRLTTEDAEVVMLVGIMPRGQTINSYLYIQTLQT